MRPQHAEAVRSIGGEQLVIYAERCIALLSQAPPFQFPPKRKMESECAALRKRLAKVSPELRILMRTLHGLNARHFSYGGPLPEGFDIVAYLEALLAVPYQKPKGDQRRQTLIMETAAVFERLSLERDPSRSGDLAEYLNIICVELGVDYDVHQLAKDVARWPD